MHGRDEKRRFGGVSYSWVGWQLRRGGLVLRKRSGCRSACRMPPVLYLKHLKQSFAPFFYQWISAFNSLRLAQNVINCLTLLVEAGASVTLNMKGAVKKVKPVSFFCVARCVTLLLCCYRCCKFARGWMPSG